MKIVYDPRFIASLISILNYIALDSKNKSIQFNKNMELKIEDLVNMPYKNRKSIYFYDENIRDLIYKGYTIVYEVDKNNNRIVIIGINKYRENI